MEFVKTNCSKNYLLFDGMSVVKMPLSEDDNKIFIINMIYESQIKRFIQYFYFESRLSFVGTYYCSDIFVISASDPAVFLNYASFTRMNITLDSISNPDELEYWILIVLDYLAFLHRSLNLVNLDIKPKNIFLGRDST
jgi:serine/threonine protein kinase